MEWLRIRRQANPSCVEAIAVNAKDIAAIDFMTASIRKDIEESPYRTLKVLCGGFF